VPVSVFAIGVDAMTLWAAFQISAASRERAARGWFMTRLGSVLLLGAGLWFIALQAFAVGWCPYCLATHASGVLAAVLLLTHARRRRDFPAGTALRAGLIGAAMMAVLVTGQVIHKPRTGMELKNFASGTNLDLRVHPVPVTNQPAPIASHPATMPPTTAPVITNPVAASPTTNPVVAPATPAQPYTPGGMPVSAMKRPFKFYEGAVALDLEDVPVIGAATNPQAVVSLFDYTCHHCRDMHPLLAEAQKAFSQQLVIASLPMPLDASCNRTMTRTPPAHTNACNLARLGLIVWRANRERHHEFDEFLMTGPEAPSFPAAVARAVQLVGTNALARAAMDPWVEERLQFSLQLYEAAYKRGQGRMPQLIVGRNVAVGTYPREELFKVLTENLDLKKQP